MSATGLLVAAYVWLALGGLASAAHLDTTFGASGKIRTDFDGGIDGPTSVLVQPDGKIVVAGRSDSRLALVRYAPDGTLDGGFGTGGKFLGSFAHGATALARQPDGKLLAAGFTLNPTVDIVLARFDAAGTLDPTFGNGGVVVTDLGVAEHPYAIALQADGRIVVGGGQWPTDDRASDVLLARYLPDGNLDPTFGTGGIVTADFGLEYQWAADIVIQPDGKPVIAGAVLARYDDDGTIDATFASGGSTPLTHLTTGLVRQPDGHLVVAFADALRRYDADGAIDPSFGSAGTTTLGAGLAFFPTDLLLQGDGSFIVPGSADVGPGFNFIHLASVRVASDGSPDPTYAPCLVLATTFGDAASTPGESRGRGGLVQADGKIVIVGDQNGDFVLARYDPTPLAACVAAASRKAAIRIKNRKYGEYDLTWKWKGAAAVDKTDFGDPTASTDMTLCVSDSDADTPFRIAALAPSESSVCAPGTCWTERANGFGYKDRSRSSDGISIVTTAGGPPGVARIVVKAKGVLDAVGTGDNAAPPYTLPARVRLSRNDGTACWESTFATASQNLVTWFRAISE